MHTNQTVAKEKVTLTNERANNFIDVVELPYLPTLMVSTKNCDALWVPHLKCNQKLHDGHYIMSTNND